MPLKVYIPPQVHEHARSAIWIGIRTWEDAVEPGVPSFLRTTSESAADIAFRFTPEPHVYTSHERKPGIHALTRATITLVVSTYTDWSLGSYRALIRMSRHEIGHALGLTGHSHRYSDVMGAGTTLQHDEGISEGDRRTIRALYDLPLPG